MKPDIRRLSIPISQLVLIDAEPSGQYTARAVGLPEIRASAATREEAIEQVRSALQQSLAAGHLVPVQVSQANPQQQPLSCADPNDPLEKEFLDDLRRFREEDLERTLREYELEDQACSDSSSTPTT